MFLLPVTGNDTLFVNCGELQDDEQFQCSLLWQQLTDNPRPYTTEAHIKLTCPERNHNQEVSDCIYTNGQCLNAFKVYI